VLDYDRRFDNLSKDRLIEKAKEVGASGGKLDMTDPFDLVAEAEPHLVNQWWDEMAAKKKAYELNNSRPGTKVEHPA
jgi:hypothetical protein